MKTSKLLTGLLAGLLVTVLFAGRAWADSDPSNDADSITVRITPNVDFGVDIDSAALQSGGLIDLGIVNLFASTQTVTPATVTIRGNITSSGGGTGQELDVSGTIASQGGGASWTFDLSPSTHGTSGELDALATYILFSDTALSTAPNGDEFSVSAAEFTGTTLRAGGAGGVSGTKFEKTDAGVTDMDDMSPDEKRHLWLFFRLPDQTTSGDSQDVTITLTAVNAST